jgi:hypothetical protein
MFGSLEPKEDREFATLVGRAMLPIKSWEQEPKPSKNGNGKNGKVSAHDSSSRLKRSRLGKKSDSMLDQRWVILDDGNQHVHSDMLPKLQCQPLPRNRRDGDRGNDGTVRHLQM